MRRHTKNRPAYRTVYKRSNNVPTPPDMTFCHRTGGTSYRLMQKDGVSEPLITIIAGISSSKPLKTDIRE